MNWFLFAQTAKEKSPSGFERAWAKVQEMIDGFFHLLPNFLLAIVVFGVIFLIARILQSSIRRWTDDRSSENLGVVLGRLAKWAMLIVGLLISVSIVAPSVGPGDVFSMLGIGSVAIGFAFKDILQNFLAGILILLREPFKVGDAIIFGEYSGVVQSIETRSTNLKTYDGQQVIIPNGQIFTSAVQVVTAYPQRRKSVVVGIGYGDDVEQARQEILKAICSVEGVLKKPAPFVHTTELAESSVNLQAFWWAKNEDYGGVNSKVLTGIKKFLDDAAIDMPYPTQVVLHHDQSEETDGDRNQQREGWPAGESPPRPRHSATNSE